MGAVPRREREPEPRPRSAADGSLRALPVAPPPGGDEAAEDDAEYVSAPELSWAAEARREVGLAGGQRAEDRAASKRPHLLRTPTGNTAGAARRFQSRTLSIAARHALAVLGQVVLVPLFLAGWGRALYGEWLTLLAIVSVFGLIEIGLKERSARMLAGLRRNTERERLACVVHTHLAVGLALAAAVTAVLLLAAALVPWEGALGFGAARAGEGVGRSAAKGAEASGAVGLVVLLLGLQVAGAAPLGVLSGLYRSLGERGRGEWLITAQRAAAIALTAAALWLGGGLVVIAAAQLAPLALTAWLARKDLARRHPEISLGVRRVDWSLTRELVRPGRIALTGRGAEALTLQGSIVLVAVQLGASSVALFVLLRMLADVVRYLTNLFTRTLWPDLATLEAARSRRASLRAVHALAVKGSMAFSLVVAMVLHHLAPWVVTVWTGGRLDHDPWLFGAFLALVVLQTPSATSAIVLSASKHSRLVMQSRLASAGIGIAAALLLSHLFGTPGVALGLLLGEAAVSGWLIPRATCQLVGQNYTEHAKGILLPGLAIGLTAAAFGRVVAIPFWSLPLGLRSLVVALVMGSLVLVVSWKGWFEGWERRRLHDLVIGKSVEL